MRCDETIGGPTAQAMQAEREERLRDAHSRIGSPDFTEDDWIEIAIQKLGYVDPGKVPAEVSRLVELYYLEMMRGDQLNPAERTPEEVAALEAIRARLYRQGGFLPASPKAKALRFTLQSSGPVSMAVEHGEGAGEARVYLAFDAVLQQMTPELEEAQRATVEEVTEQTAENVAAVSRTCPRCGCPEERHHPVSQECPMPYGGFTPRGQRAGDTFTVDPDPTSVYGHRPPRPPQVEPANTGDVVHVHTKQPTPRKMAVSDCLFDPDCELPTGWWIELASGEAMFLKKHGPLGVALVGPGIQRHLYARDFVRRYARVELRDGDLPPVGTYWTPTQGGAPMRVVDRVLSPAGDGELVARFEGGTWARSEMFTMGGFEEAPPPT